MDGTRAHFLRAASRVLPIRCGPPACSYRYHSADPILLVVGALPFWDAFPTRSLAQAAMRGTNAAVVGVLGAALYDPVWTSAVRTPYDFAVALTGFFLLTMWKAPPWVVVVLTAAGGVALGRS